MKKLRSDSKWNGLPGKQLEMVLNWLFDEGMGYEAALQRARLELGVVASVSSLKRFYQHVAEERRIGELVSAGGSVAEYRAAAAKVLGMATLNVATQGDHRDSKDVRQLVVLMKLLLREQQQALTAERLGLQLEQWEVKGRVGVAKNEDGGWRMEDGKALRNEDAGGKLPDGKGKAVAKGEYGSEITVQKGASIKGMVG